MPDREREIARQWWHRFQGQASVGMMEPGYDESPMRAGDCIGLCDDDDDICPACRHALDELAAALSRYGDERYRSGYRAGAEACAADLEGWAKKRKEGGVAEPPKVTDAQYGRLPKWVKDRAHEIDAHAYHNGMFDVTMMICRAMQEAYWRGKKERRP